LSCTYLAHHELESVLIIIIIIIIYSQACIVLFFVLVYGYISSALMSLS